MTSYDILFNGPSSSPTFDLLIINGDFIIGISEQQETDLLINTFTGNWFQYPLVGVGILQYLASNISPVALENLIKNQMKTDGFIVDSVTINGSTIEEITLGIEAHR